MKMHQASTDLELFLGCRDRIPSVQKAVYEKYCNAMYAVCLRYIKETAAAEDTLVVAFTKVFERINQFKATGSFGGWIRRIIVNECLMYLEKEKNLYNEIGLDSIPAAVQYTPSDELGLEDLMKLINSLPVGYRTVFNLYAIEGYSHQEIADRLKITENTSKSQLCRARCHLQRMISKRVQKKSMLKCA